MGVAADGPTTARVEAFSDGVVAIAATLLVIELAVPAAGEDVVPALVAELPSIAAFVTSFLTILILWVNHHALFAAVRHVDRPLMFLNGLLLLGITFISYPTAVLGRALQGAESARAAAVFYGVVLALTAATFTVIWAYLLARPHLLEPAARERAGPALRRSLVGPALYLVGVLVALVSAPAALAVDAAVAVFFMVSVPRRRS